MKVEVRCNDCGVHYRVDAATVGGKTLKCRKCGGRVDVPEVGELDPDDEDEAAVDQSEADDDTFSGSTVAAAPVVRISDSDDPAPLIQRPPPRGGFRKTKYLNPKVRKSDKKADEPQFTFSDEVTTTICGVLVLLLVGGTIYGGMQFREIFTTQNRIPDEVATKITALTAFVIAWFNLVVFLVATPVILLATAIAGSWTSWRLPDRPFLRAAGTASIPYLFLIAGVIAMVKKEHDIGIGMIIVMPIFLVAGMKELMGLKWSTTGVAIGLLLVIAPVVSLVVKPVTDSAITTFASAIGLDEAGAKKYRQEHPEQFAGGAPASPPRNYGTGSGGTAYSPPERSFTPPAAPIPIAVDPLLGKIEPLMRSLNQALAQAKRGTREQVQVPVAELKSQLEALRPGEASPLWDKALALYDEVIHAVANAPSGLPPEQLFTAIPPGPLPVKLVDSSAQSSTRYAFKSIRVQPLVSSYIDIDAYADRESFQRWVLGPTSTIEVSLAPAGETKQQRPWVTDRDVIMQAAVEKNLLAVKVEATATSLFGRRNGIAWTRIAPQDSVQPTDKVLYIARVGDEWLTAHVHAVAMDQSIVDLADAFVQGISLPVPNSAASDPFAMEQVVTLFDRASADPSAFLRASGVAAVTSLQDYIDRRGDAAPARAKTLLDELISAAPRGAITLKPISAEEITRKLNVLKGSDRLAKADVLKSLARAQPSDADRPAIAEALEGILGGEDAATLGDDAARALGIWFRPQTTAAMLPHLEENAELPKRLNAMRVLAKTRDKKAVFPIVRWLIKDTENAEKTLREMGAVAEDEVIKLLREPTPAVRASAARILQEIGTQKCQGELRRASLDPRDASSAAVAKIALAEVMDRIKAARNASATQPAP